MEPFGNTLMGVVVAVIYLGIMGAIAIGWIIGLVALWRGMKAHESIAESLKETVKEKQKE